MAAAFQFRLGLIMASMINTKFVRTPLAGGGRAADVRAARRVLVRHHGEGARPF